MPVRKSRKSQTHPKPAGISELFAPVAEQLELVRSQLVGRLTSRYDSVNHQMESVGAGQGKLFRAAMVLLSGKAIGSIRHEHIEFAMMVELVHTATLLHDDVIDQARTRRNQPTMNQLWGNTAAVLMGDFLLSRAFLAGAELNIPRSGKILSQTAEQICQGELLQNLRQGDVSLTEEDYLEIIEGKTASLFSAACVLGALASKADPVLEDMLREYGRCVGMAFQITDDILDITGDDKHIGKTLGTDLGQNKLTLPLIYCLRKKRPAARKTLIESLSQMDKTSRIEQLQLNGSLDLAREKASDYAQIAVKALGRLKPGTARESLEKIALTVSSRS
ncbi:MAG: polyprenyl synthetase family protein [Sedimentisphaerales bacterium]|nr:polyprenyl synthetase family protein [Sedimentisphaerales bacterium]